METIYRIIRTGILLVALLCAGGGAYAQEQDIPNRDIALKIVNKKGKPINKVFAQSILTGRAGITDRSGLFVFKDISDNDTLAVTLPKIGNASFPVAGMDSIVITVQSAIAYSYHNSEGQYIEMGKNRLEMSNVLNVQEMLKKRSYRNLSQLLQGHFTQRGVSSALSSTEPLVVVDGSSIGTIADADRYLNVRDIQTIEIQKDGFEWGARGANGVIVIKTR